MSKYITPRAVLPEPPIAVKGIVSDRIDALRRMTDREARRLAFAATVRAHGYGESIPRHWLALIKLG